MSKKRVIKIIIPLAILIIFIIVIGVKTTPAIRGELIAKNYGLAVERAYRTDHRNVTFKIYATNVDQIKEEDLLIMIEKIEKLVGIKYVELLQYEDSGDLIRYREDNGRLSIYNLDQAERLKKGNKVSNGESSISNSSISSTISGKKCGICKEPATQEINNEYFCDEHFKNAVDYYLD